jgi:hypothetical protein
VPWYFKAWHLFSYGRSAQRIRSIKNVAVAMHLIVHCLQIVLMEYVFHASTMKEVWRKYEGDMEEGSH